MTTLKTGDKRLISYAVDLGTRLTTQFDCNRNIVREMDERGAQVVIVEGISEAGEGAAVMDRLRRAASEIIS